VNAHLSEQVRAQFSELLTSKPTADIENMFIKTNTRPGVVDFWTATRSADGGIVSVQNNAFQVTRNNPESKLKATEIVVVNTA
jgi:hypothetical protein